ncbi:MAG: EVE domain-containing protein [Candidatus Sericytochromatia bacterium]
MATFLLKTEPETYSYADLERDGQTAWDGVRNHLAMRYLRAMQPGDEAFIYHSVSDKQVVGIAQVVSPCRPDPKDESGKFDCLDIAPVRKLKRPVTLAEFKAAGWHDFDLVRMSRLSVMPVPDAVRDWILAAELEPAVAGK